ncbi:MAG: 50S ribosomal protein L4 [Planctomycetes bacterium]|nr:50S ribosomal protein L4 [Planctomycetota bacterium]
MIEIPVYNMDGSSGGTESIDPSVLGGHVRPKLLKQAVVMYQANRRQNTSATKSRGMVSGSTRKIYRQKGTGNARAGAIRTCVRRGGGVAFAKGKQNYTQDLPKKMRRLARNSAILAKLKSGDVAIVDGLKMDKPQTKAFAAMLSSLGVDRGCLVATKGEDRNVILSGRNLRRTEVRCVRNLNAYDVLRRNKFVMSMEAFRCLKNDPVRLRDEADG